MPDESVLVGVDFTADQLRVLLTDEHGRRVHDGDWPLPPLADEDAWSWEVGGRIATLFADEGSQRSALSIAVAAPGTVDAPTGRLVRCETQPAWDGLAIVDALRRHIDAPVAAENRTLAALLAEAWQGAAAGSSDVLYVSLRSMPAAALLVGGRVVRGAHLEAGALPAVPQVPSGGALGDAECEQMAGVLADAAALVDPEYVVIDGEPAHLERLVPLLQRVLKEVAPGPTVVPSELGERAAVIGAIRLARPLAFEGGRRP
jgi:predicted NBD/HSP70 family sugar kinase